MSRRAAASGRLLAQFVSLLAFIACAGDGPQVPTTLAPPSTAALSGVVGSTVTSPPTVTLADQKGRGINGVWVYWKVTSGNGHVVSDSSQTNTAGVASSGGWTLGGQSGAQTLTASASGLAVTTFTAIATAGPIQTLLQWSPVQTGVVNTPLPAPPAVRAVDGFGNAVPGVVVAFTVTKGGGTLTGPQQTTNADGVATATGWLLGKTSGDQMLIAVATTAGISATITARALGGAAVDLALAVGDAQVAGSGKKVCTPPTVKVLDQYGNGVASIPVTFIPVTNSGTVTKSTVLSDTAGNAAVGAWTLGTLATETLVGTSTSLPGKQVVFTANVGAAPGFSICARFVGDGGTPRQREAVTKAVARWQKVIVGHVQTTHLTAHAGECTDGIPAIDEDVEDLLLFVQLAPIDGPRGIIGQAAPCYIHLPAALTLMGFLQLDIADLDLMLAEGTLDNVVLHEIGHILGIGTLWNYRRSLLSGAGGLDPFFMGSSARSGFLLTGSPYGGTPVPVENTGGAGTRDSHWRKSVFGTELMQGFSAPNMPLSSVTIGSLADLGYQVNLGAADAFSLLPALRTTDAVIGAELTNDVANTGLWGVEQNGARHVLRVPSSVLRK
jgi:hypothetical protein